MFTDNFSSLTNGKKDELLRHQRQCWMNESDSGHGRLNWNWDE